MTQPVIVITGASSGIGFALAHTYASAGYAVVMAARNEQKLSAAAAKIREHGNPVLTVVTDVSDRNACRELIDATVAGYGRIDILINNAGISMRALFKDLDLEVIDQLMAINFFGTVNCTHFALPHILKSKGSIVGVSSIAGFRGLPARTGYSSSKFAMHGFLESLRTELLKTGVHVLLACPGFTESNIRNAALTADGSHQGKTPLKEDKLMTSDEVAKHIFKAVQKKKRTLILTRQGKMTVFMNKLFGKWMDKKVYQHFAREPGSELK